MIDRLLEQAKPFHATFHLGQEVTEVQPLPDGKIPGGHLLGHAPQRGSRGDRRGRGLVSAAASDACPASRNSRAGACIIASSPRPTFTAAICVICGGGDSALDWTVALCEKARSLTLVHRRAEFRAAPATVARMRELVAAGKMQFLEGHVVALHGDRPQAHRGGRAEPTMDIRPVQVAADHVLAFYGLHPKLGPVAEWGLELEKKALKVDTERFQTSVPGIFAIGDINTYPGKKKLILSGFHEAALTAFAIQHHLFPAETPVPAVHHDEPDHAEAAGRRPGPARPH